MAFEDGMRFGADALQQGINNARQAKLDLQNEEERGLRMQGIRRAAAREQQVDAAFDDYSKAAANEGLGTAVRATLGQRYGVAPGDVRANMTGMGVPYDPDQVNMDGPVPDAGIASRRGMLAARQKIATASRDVRGMQAGEEESRGLDVEADSKANLARLNDPKYRDELFAQVNDKNPHVMIHQEKDAKGNPVGSPLLIVRTPDGGTKRADLNEGQVQRLAYASALAKNGKVPEAMNLIASVDKDLAEAVARANKTTTDAYTADSTNRYHTGVVENARLGRDEQGRHNRAMEAKAGAAAGRQISPETLGKMRDLEIAFTQANGDPRRQSQIRQQYDMLSSIASAETGRPRGLPAGKPQAQFKYNQNENGSFYTNEDGVAVAKHDPNLGMVPFEPSPLTDKAVAAKASRAGITVVPGQVDGRVMWGFVTPDQRVFDTFEDAETAVQSQKAGATRSSDRTDAARLVLPPADTRRAGLPSRQPLPR